MDRERLQRFEREAQTLAALNHPHLAGILGLEDAGNGTRLADVFTREEMFDDSSQTGEDT